MVLSTLGRLIWLPIAFVLSGMVATMVLLSLGLERITGAAHAQDGDMTMLIVLLEIVRQGHLLASGLTLIPAVLVVIIGEVARIRSALFYILGGGLALAALPLLARMGQVASATTAPGGIVPPTLVWQVFATAGFAGGGLYWLLAGRKA